MAKLRDPEFESHEAAAELIDGSDLETDAFVSNLEATPEFMGLPGNIQDEIRNVFESFDTIMDAVENADTARYNELVAEMNLADAEQFAIKWEVWKERLTTMAKVLPIVALIALVAYGAAGAEGGFSQLGAAMTATAGSSAVAGGYYGLRHLTVNKKKNAERKLKLAQAKAKSSQKNVEIKAFDEVAGGTRELERKEMLTSQGARVLAEANPDIDEATLKQELKRLSGVDSLRVTVEAMQKYLKKAKINVKLAPKAAAVGI